jgi:hypothetical protein
MDQPYPGIERLLHDNHSQEMDFRFVLFIYLLFICHDGMQPGGHGSLEKQIKILERGRTNNSEVISVKMQKRECGTAIPNAAKSKQLTLPQCPFPSTVSLLRPQGPCELA